MVPSSSSLLRHGCFFFMAKRPSWCPTTLQSGLNTFYVAPAPCKLHEEVLSTERGSSFERDDLVPDHKRLEDDKGTERGALLLREYRVTPDAGIEKARKRGREEQ